ncbi:MAG TPA: bifunctional diaminohydroxyphosphoribosylaminopyrimidine deaminase/5-amino-6-(5-phosphoribosylamino)uracil reductase RibD [Morganella sp. (in: Bacteria)]|nr:bifunctional diaminohydroxyphosphoribosylaminopyrimidine deaminase/5-amino-6-(5-phosphoribosylamino)uracil reductase RibD [Morganella sp. (in: enterobacteria)]
MMQSDEFYMVRALELAALGRFTTAPNPNVGCVIVRDGEIVGEGYHKRAGEPHAEVHALRMAGENARGATAYVTLEPCSHHGRTPPCAEALVNAGISRVVAAMQDPNPQVAGRGLYKLREAGIEVSHGVLMQEAEALNKGFFKLMRTGFPYIQLKMAASVDGKTALANGKSQWITSKAARQDVQQFRAQAGAILSTSATVLADDPGLTVRYDDFPPALQEAYPQDEIRQPVRIITDSRQRVTAQYRVTQLPGSCWLARTQSQPDEWQGNVEEIILPENGTGVDLVSLMMQLGKRGINTVWTECGSHLAGALLKAGLADEIVLYLAPKILGSGAQDLFTLPPLTHLSDAPEFRIDDVTLVGPDIRLRLIPVY